MTIETKTLVISEELKKKLYYYYIALDPLEQIASIDANSYSTMVREKPYVKKYILK